MLTVTRKNLFTERTRLAISVGGVTLSVFLIGVLLSLFRGWDQKVGGYVEEVPTDLWVASEGATDFIQAASIVPGGLGRILERQPEVATASPLIVRPLNMTKAGQSFDQAFDVQLVGYDPTARAGGPLKVVAGKSPPGPGEVVVDQVLADRRNVHIGDRLVRGSRSLTVVGISGRGDFIFTQVAYATLETAAEFLDLDPAHQRTFFLLTLRDPEARGKLEARLRAGAPGLVLLDSQEFANETRERLIGNILPILIVVLIVAFIVGLAVAGLTIYTATVEKSREYGILKAEGFTNLFLYRVVFEQSLVTSLLGFLLGAGLTILVAPFASDLVPQFVVLIRWQDVAGIAAATLLMALMASYIPMRRLTAIDPVTAFKG
jgi:putative ABC transport system permease protein